jgi:hypothetical protein
MNKAILFLIGMLLTLYVGIVRSQSLERPEQDEIQVLIDVSGSMKQNDPHNLRVEATRLMINLLPDKISTAIWLFDENTKKLTETDAVDANWKNQAIKLSSGIHSKGLYTDLEKAIQTVLKDGFKGNGAKNLIILTDGFVDISKDIMVSADSRERILSEWLPKLQQEKIKVLTIALSNQADKELLDKLAFATDGWSQISVSADDLQRAFLKLLLKAAPKEHLPLQGNQFAVDSGVEEFSTLVFKKPSSAPSVLYTPDQSKINKQTASGNVAWLETPGYDLITIKKPVVGQWRLDAGMDPDDQVMIVTDLKMQVNEIPNYISEKDSVSLKVNFMDKQKLITDSNFLGLISVSLIVDQQAAISLQAIANQPGYFGDTINNLSAGKHVLKVLADGKTFKREDVEEIQVFAEVVHLEIQKAAHKRDVTIKFLPDLSIVDGNSLVISANVVQGEIAPETRKVTNQNGILALELENLPAETVTTVSFNILAKTVDGKAISPNIKPITIDDSFFSKAADIAGNEAEHAATEKNVQHSEKSEENHPEPTDDSISWLVIAGIVFAINAILIGSGFLIYRIYKNANDKRQQEILEKLS